MNVKAKITGLCSNQQYIKANAQLIFDNCFVVKGIKVVQGNEGLYVTMPAEKQASKDENGKHQYIDIAHPITKEARELINGEVLKEYKLALAKEAEIKLQEQEQEMEV